VLGKLEAQEKAGKLSKEGEARLKTARVLKDLSPATVVRLQRMGVSIDPRRSVQIAGAKPKKMGLAAIKVEKGTRFVGGERRVFVQEGEKALPDLEHLRPISHPPLLKEDKTLLKRAISRRVRIDVPRGKELKRRNPYWRKRGDVL
jgi:hypothetical protein